MEIQDFKSKWNGQPIELISAAEADVLVNLDREKEERLDYIRTKVAAIGWNVSAVVPVASGTYNRVRHMVVIGENTVGNSCTKAPRSARSLNSRTTTQR